MKNKLTLFVFFLLLFGSCRDDEPTGICTACCDANGDQICKGNFSEKMCHDYNKRKVDGHDWTYSGPDTICTPRGPD